MRIHSTILAAGLIATAAVGLASASIYSHASDAPAIKGDRLPVAANADGYRTVETRGDGVSVLAAIPVD